MIAASASAVDERTCVTANDARALLPALLIVLDTDGRIVRWGHACELLTGYVANETVGVHMWDLLVPKEEAASVRSAFEEMVQRKLPSRFESTLVTRDGEHRWILWTNRFEPGRSRVVATGVDITDHRHSEQLLAAREAELVRTAHGRDEALGVVAHDLRGPLTAIVLLSQMLQRSPGPDRAISAAAGILRAAGRMDGLIQDLLDVTRIQGGHFSITTAPEAIASIVSEAADDLRPLAREKSIALEVTVCQDLPLVLADRRRLLQVLANIGDNAVKFTPHGGRIEIQAAAAGAMVLVSLCDNGPGIGASQIEHLFDAYWQGDVHDARGLGLGLAIAKGIIDAHGGRIWAESTEGAGSTFRFTLPVAGAQGQATVTQEDPTLAGRPAPT